MFSQQRSIRYNYVIICYQSTRITQIDELSVSERVKASKRHKRMKAQVRELRISAGDENLEVVIYEVL